MMETELADRRIAASKRLIRLLDQTEFIALTEQLSLPPNANLDTVVQALADFPRYRALQVVLKAAEPTIVLLQDIIRFLEKQGISARTTGFSLALANPVHPDSAKQIDLSAQEVGQVCSFSAKTLHTLGDDPFNEICKDWWSLNNDWDALMSQAEPNIQRGELDLVDSYISKEAVFDGDTDHTDYDALSVLEFLVVRVEETRKILERIPSQDRTTSIRRILNSFCSLLRRADTDVFQRADKSQLRRIKFKRKKLRESTVRRYVNRRFLNIFERVNEDIRALADFEASEKIFDVLSVDLWSTRPQLYEVWLLTQVLDWIMGRGYQVSLLNLALDANGKVVWRLSYAKERCPCAQIQNGKNVNFVFYQLYRVSGDMPDICALLGTMPTSSPLWSIDAKHSELRGYSLNSYRTTAIGYRDSFGAPLSLVVEYFQRQDIAAENPISFGTGAALIKDARPGGDGVSIVFDCLAAYYPAIGTILICIDYSSSFSCRLAECFDAAMLKLRDMAVCNILDRYVCFAETALVVEGMHAFINGNGHKELPDLPLQEGTSIRGVMEEIKCIKTDSTLVKVIFIGDGQFSEPDWLQRIEGEIGCSIEIWN